MAGIVVVPGCRNPQAVARAWQVNWCRPSLKFINLSVESALLFQEISPVSASNARIKIEAVQMVGVCSKKVPISLVYQVVTSTSTKITCFAPAIFLTFKTAAFEKGLPGWNKRLSLPI